MKLITDEQAGALTGALLRGYLKACEDNRLNATTAGAIIGVSATRLGSLKKSLAEGDPTGVKLGVFLRAKQFLASIPDATEAGILPAKAQRGAAQEAVLAHYGLVNPVDDEAGGAE